MSIAVELKNVQPLLIELLLDKGLLTTEQVNSITETRLKDHSPLESLLVKMGMVLGEQIAEVYADYLMLPLLDKMPTEVDVSLARSAAGKALPRPPLGAGGARRGHRRRGLRHV